MLTDQDSLSLNHYSSDFVNKTCLLCTYYVLGIMDIVYILSHQVNEMKFYG